MNRIAVFRNKTLPLPAVMGILNVTPDSFFDGGRYVEAGKAFARAAQIIMEGAGIVDIGGQSSRPGAAQSLTDEQEAARVLPVLEGVRRQFPETVLSVDTTRESVARRALAAGADLINDIRALQDSPGLAEEIARHRAGVVLMHMQGRPETMQHNPRYGDVVGEILAFLEARAAFAVSRGIRPESVILDPGIGFGKTPEHNLMILRHLADFRSLGFPLLVGVSRKAFIGGILGGAPPDARLIGSVAALMEARMRGADLFRVHDVRESAEALAVSTALARAPERGAAV